MRFWQVVLDALAGRHERWDPDADEDVRYLREQQVASRREVIRLRRRPAWEDLFAPGGD